MRVRASLLMAALAAGSVSAEPVVPVFEKRPIPPHVYAGGWEHFVGGGLASFDCNGDGRPELYAAGGTEPAALMRNVTRDGTLAYAEDTPDALALTGVTGVYPLDIDGDGMIDLAILRAGPDRLMRGTGDCGFAPFEGLGFESGDQWTTPFSATWESGQTLPTLAFGTYVDRTDPDGPFEACDDTFLYRPNGGSYPPPQRLSPGFCALSASSPTGTAPDGRTCVCPTTAITTSAAARSSSGRWRPSRGSIRRRMVGGAITSGAWASPRATSTGTATRMST